MRMNWLVILGVFVVLVGVSILLQVFFGFRLPIVRTALAILFLFIGARMLLSAWSPSRLSGDHTSMMSESLFRPEQATGGKLKYDILFSKGTVDLTQLPPLEHDLTVEVNTVFSSALVRVGPSVPYEVEGSAAFGAVQLPTGEQAGFGPVYRNAPTGASGPRLRLKLNAVFGHCRLEEGRGALTEPRAMVPPPTERHAQ